MDDDEVVNDALAIAQHITQYLEDNEAVNYLLAIEQLSLDDWKTCKTHLEGVNKSNRTWKEGHIRDVVELFRNGDVKKRFLLRNLSLCPGFSRPAVELCSFQASTLYAVAHISRESSRLRSPLHSEINQSVNLTQSQSAFPAQQQSRNVSQQQINGHSSSSNRSLPPSSSWGETNNTQQSKTIVKDVRKPNTPRTWYVGTNQSVFKEKKLPQTSVCLAVKSGSDETCESLK